MSEIDREVAEKVMGWELRELFSSGSGQYLWYADRSETDSICPHIMADPRHWSPSTNIAQTWEVVETIDGLFHVFRCKNGWGAWIINRANGFKVAESEIEETAPLAICKAALEAVKADTDESSTTHPLPTTQGNRNE